MSQRAFITELDALLKPLGFHRRKQTWNRGSGAFIDVVDLQRSKAGDRITLNLGVLVPSIHRACWGEPPPEFVQEPFCTVCTRLFDREGRELWWPVEDADGPGDVRRLFEQQGMSFIERMHSFSEMRDFLAPRIRRPVLPEAIYRCLLNSELGNVSEACAELHALQLQGLGDWGHRIESSLAHLRCHEA
jgi:hypothetical protein